MDTADTNAAPPAEATAPSRPAWWREALLILAFYLVYGWIRNRFGSAAVGPETAYRNAEYVIDIERWMRLYVEADIQGWFLDWGWFLRIWNIFYGTGHFLITGFALAWLYRRDPEHYAFWRTTGLTTTGLALVGFATFPLMPPRLIGDCGRFGACVPSEFVDTVAVHGGWWTFTSGTMEAVSNQYAAMPSLHFAWAYWSFLVLAPRLENRAAVWFMRAYPWLTVFAIVVTANHFWIDAVGGGLVLAVGWIYARWWHGREGGRFARS